MLSKEELRNYVSAYCDKHQAEFKAMVETAFVPMVEKGWYHRTYDPTVSSVMNHQVDLYLQQQSRRFNALILNDPIISESCYTSLGFSYTPTEATFYVRFRSKIALTVLHQHRLDTPHVFTAKEKQDVQ